MKIVCMVPSLTETLIASGANVVGRTRFCIHPHDRIKQIPAVGGTKDVDWEKVLSLAPDLLILDREENPQSMALEADVRGQAYFATHVKSVTSVADELSRLATRFNDRDPQTCAALNALVARWRSVGEKQTPPLVDWSRLPGVLEWVREPKAPSQNFAYLIWRKPWMAAGRDTFIASMLEAVGLPQKNLWPAGDKKYPEVDLTRAPENLVLLFSSEPYPFQKKSDWRPEITNPAAIVNGESFSWFGLRSLEFLEACKKARKGTT